MGRGVSLTPSSVFAKCRSKIFSLTIPQEYVATIYNYQVAEDGETIEWDLAQYNPPLAENYDSFINKTIERVDVQILTFSILQIGIRI